MGERPTFNDSLTVLPSPHQPTSSRKSIFLSQSLWVPFGARGVFGGQVIAQSLVAAGKTVKSPLGLHSQHCYFLLPALADPPIAYHVENIRDGKSYANRLVKAIQREKVIFILAASYTLPPIHLPKLETGSTPMSFQPYLPDAPERPPAVSHSLRFAVDSSDGPNVHPIPTGVDSGWIKNNGIRRQKYSERFQLDFPEDVLPPEECPEEEARWEKYLTESRESMSEKRKMIIDEYIRERKESPVSISAARFRDRDATDGFSSGNVRMTWTRARFSSGEKPDLELTKAMIAYITDFQFIGTAAQSVGLTWTSQPRLGMLATLDHSIHYYPFPSDFTAGDPMLHVMESVAADVGAGRGLVRGLLFDRKGRLLAATLQEGVVRANFGKTESPKAKL